MSKIRIEWIGEGINLGRKPTNHAGWNHPCKDHCNRRERDFAHQSGRAEDDSSCRNDGQRRVFAEPIRSIGGWCLRRWRNRHVEPVANGALRLGSVARTFSMVAGGGSQITALYDPYVAFKAAA